MTKLWIRWLMLILCIGFISGSASAFFLLSLAWVTEIRGNHIFLYALLPVFAGIVGLLYHFYGKESTGGNNLIIQEIYQPKSQLPLKMPFLIYLTTILTHLGGGSSGREGTAVQMSGGFADWIGSFFSLNTKDRSLLLLCGISAGFSSVFGTPLTGFVFAFELTKWKFFQANKVIPILASAIWAHYVCHLWSVEHQNYQIIELPNFQWILVSSLLILALISGVFARLFVIFHQQIHSFFSKIQNIGIRAFLGGIVIVFLNFFTVFRYAGIGTDVILESFQHKVPFYDSICKLIFTGITLGSGMKGGEVTPLFFIGSTLGNSIAIFFDQPISFFAGLGFVTVFGAAAKTPIACTIMAFELFGYQMIPFALFTCWVAYVVSGKAGIYKNNSLI